MADGTIAINEPASGDTDKRIDTEQLTVSSTTVERERIQVTGTSAADIAPVDATAGLKVDLGADNDVTVTGDALTALQLIDDAISGGEMQVDIVSGNVTNAGTFVTQLDGDALTALQLIDNIVQTEDVAHSTGDSGVMLLGVENEDQAALTAGDKDYTPIAVTPEGNIIVKQEGTITVDLGANNDVTLNASTANIGDVDLELNGTAVSGNNGTADAGTIRVTVASDSTGVLSVDDNGGNLSIDDGGNAITVDNAGTFATQVDGDALTALQLIDNIVQTEDVAHSTGDSGVMLLGVENEDQAALTAGDKDYTPIAVTPEGNVIVKQEGSIAVDSHAVTNAGTFATQVDGDALTALQLLDNAVSGSGYNITQLNGVNVTMGNGASGTGVQRVTIASDTTGVLSIDDNGGDISIDDGGNTITVDGTVTANLSATDNAVLDTIDAALDTIKVDTEAIETAVEIMDDWDNAASDGASVSGEVAHDGVDAGEPVKMGGRAQEPTAQPDEVANDDRVDALLDRAGRSAVYQGYPRIYADINDSTSGNNTIIAAQAAGKKILITSVVIVSDGTTDVRFESGANGTALTGQIPLQAREGFSANDPWGLFETAAATLLNLELTAAVNVHGWVSGHVIDD